MDGWKLIAPFDIQIMSIDIQIMSKRKYNQLLQLILKLWHKLMNKVHIYKNRYELLFLKRKQQQVQVWQSSTYKIVKVIKLLKKLPQRILGDFFKIIIITFIVITLMKDDHGSYIHNFCSCEQKAWKKFRLVLDSNPWPLRNTSAALYQLS